MENFDFGRGHGRNFDHLTMVILKFWPWSWSKNFDHMTMTSGRRPNGQKIMVALPPPPNLSAHLHLFESAEALYSGVACYRLSRTEKLATYLLYILPYFFPPNAFLRRRRKKALLRVNDRGGGWKMCIL